MNPIHLLAGRLVVRFLEDPVHAICGLLIASLEQVSVGVHRQLDRSVLFAYINDFAIRHNTPVIDLGKSLRAFMEKTEYPLADQTDTN